MPLFGCRSAACRLRGAFAARLAAFTLFLFTALSLHAVVVRGRLTDSLGKPLPGGQVRLVAAGKVVAFTIAGPDGSFELRSSEAGRFTLLGSAGGFLPFVGTDFYGGATDIVEQNVALSARTIRQEVSVTATGLPTPLPQLTAPVSFVTGGDLQTRVGVIEELRQSPGVFVVQQGQYGSLGSLFVRGGQSDSNKVLIDGVPANEIGGTFDFGALQSTGIEQMEIYRGPDSVLYGSDAEASVVSISTPRGSGLRPLFTYSGDAGNLHTWRNEATIGGAWRKLDYFAGGSRFDSSNALPDDRFHATTAAANVGYELFPQTFLRATVRSQANAQGLPGAWDFQALSVPGRQYDRNTYAEATLENTTESAWHNLVRYGIERDNELENYYGQVGTPISVYGYPEYFGNPVTIRGANGYTTTGQASLFYSDDSQRSDRDELYFQSDKALGKHLSGLFGFRYENERGEFVVPSYAEDESTQRTNFEYTLQFQGDAFHRLFYSVGGAIEKNHLYGVAGTPRVGLAYVPVTPSAAWFHGTKLRATAATGVREPSITDEFTSLYTQLQQAGASAQIAAYNVKPIQETRSRTYDLGVDQNIFGERLVFKLGYFHNQFNHQIDYVDASTLSEIICHQPSCPAVPGTVYGAEVNTLAYLAQGIETELEAKPAQHWFVHLGYTYLDARVEQSFSTDAAYNGLSNNNPNYPDLPIGSSYPLVGARPFRRPPHTGFFAVNYTRTKLAASMKASIASRSDDSTFLSYSDVYGGNTLLLPNHNLDFGYVRLDLGAKWQFKPRFALFTQMDNLLNDQHIGPIGYPGLPFTVRAGMKVRVGGD